jgi:phosphoribosylformylglycinamidine (FGAM) synthase PurS component
LQSNNWNKYKPRVICIESPQDSDKNSQTIIDYLDQRGYQLVEQTQLSKVFVTKIYLQSVIGGDTLQHLK